MKFTFQPATREQTKARIALQGPAGCGKTKSALRIAEGLAEGGLIGLVDTERGSALKYAPVPGRPDLESHTFHHMPMDTHDPRNLIAAVGAAHEAGLAVLIVDSWSHFWNGRGGLLEIVEEAGSQRGAGGSFGGWRVGNPIEQEMLDALLRARLHLIVTMRTKGDFVIEDGRDGRKKVTKVGVKAVQREGTEYELDVVMDMVEGYATVTKTRYSPLAGQSIHHPGSEVGALILDQLGYGVDPVQVIVDQAAAADLTFQVARDLHADAMRRGVLDVGIMHPVSGTPLTLGAYIVERGSAVRPGLAAAPVPAAEATPATAAPQAPAPVAAAEGTAPSPEPVEPRDPMPILLDAIKAGWTDCVALAACRQTAADEGLLEREVSMRDGGSIPLHRMIDGQLGALVGARPQPVQEVAADGGDQVPPPGEWGRPAQDERRASPAQCTAIATILGALGVAGDRPRRLAIVTGILGRAATPVPTMKDLTMSEAGSVIEALSALQHRPEPEWEPTLDRYADTAAATSQAA